MNSAVMSVKNSTLVLLFISFLLQQNKINLLLIAGSVDDLDRNPLPHTICLFGMRAIKRSSRFIENIVIIVHARDMNQAFHGIIQFHKHTEFHNRTDMTGIDRPDM